jgi:hypothetical protein
VRRSVIICLTAILLLGVTSFQAAAQEEDFFDFEDFEDSDGSGDAVGAIAEEPEVLTISGELEAEFLSFLDDEEESELDMNLKGELEFAIHHKDDEGLLRLTTEIEKNEEGSVRWEDLVDEAWLRHYFGRGFFEAGYTRLEWGKGDGLHALDPINPLDLSEGYTINIIDLKRPVPLLRTVLYTGGSNGMLEAVLIPEFKPAENASSGRWLPFASDALPPVAIEDGSPEFSLENMQYALRYTFSTGPLDLGFQYYYGHLHDPGFRIIPTADPASPELSTRYTRVHIFGTEGAAALGIFTFREELGFILSEDEDGDEESLFNNRLVYLGGFDFTVPGTSLFLSAQLMGDYTFDTDDLSDSDVDELTGYGSPSHQNSLILSGEHPFNHDKLLLRLSGIYIVEAENYFIVPELLYDISDNMELAVSGEFYGGETDPFGALANWKDNDLVRLKLRYSF